MKKLAMTLGLIAVMLMAVTVMSEEKKAADQPAAEMGAPPEMKQVDFMIGIWDVDMQYRMTPDAEWMSATATNTSDLILDGCVLESELEADMGGMPMTGINMTTYNRGLKMWQSMWTDNFGNGISLYTGGFADGKMIFAGEDVMPDGRKLMSRVTSYNITDTTYDWTMENSMDDGQTWYTSMKATYTKRQ